MKYHLQKIWVLAAAIAAATTARPCAGADNHYTTQSETMKISVKLSFDAPTSYYEFDGKTLSWRAPTNADSHYIMVGVHSMDGGFPVPGCKAKAIVTTLKGKAVGTTITLQETWNRESPHYGANIQLPDELTSGDVIVKIDPPKGRRLGKNIGDFFTESVIVTFDHVDFTIPKQTEDDNKMAPPAKIEWPKGRRPYIKPTPYPGAKTQ